MSLLVIDRFHPRLRQEQQAVVDAGQLRTLEELELLQPQTLSHLTRLSLSMLFLGALFFIAVNLTTYHWQQHTFVPQIAGWGWLLWLVLNCIGYIVILPIHELLHGAAFVLWGGKPYYGMRLPFALYCGAKNQLFSRRQYLVVGLAPFVVITAVGIGFTLLFPALALYTLFATIGNVSGAAGDVLVAKRLLRYPASVLIEDTETGYRIWELLPFQR